MTIGYKQIKCNISTNIFQKTFNSNIDTLERKVIMEIFVPDDATVVKPNWDCEVGECVKNEQRTNIMHTLKIISICSHSKKRLDNWYPDYKCDLWIDDPLVINKTKSAFQKCFSIHNNNFLYYENNIYKDNIDTRDINCSYGLHFFDNINDAKNFVW